MATPYEDALTPEEEQQLAEMGDAAPAPAEEAAAQAEPSAAVESEGPAVEAPAQPETAQSEDERRAAFRSQHAGKSAEELLDLAFDQTKRASAAGYQARQSRDTVEAINLRLQAARDRATQRRQAVDQRDERFKADMQADPDRATQAVHDEMVAAERAQIDADEFRARQDAALSLAATAIPDFEQVMPEVRAFGLDMNYTADELDNLSDGRDVVTLYMAERFARLLRAGIVDMRGQMQALPAAATARDPRLTAPPPPKTVASVPGRTAAAQTAEQRMQDMLNLPDDEFDKIAGTPEFANLMRQAG